MHTGIKKGIRTPCLLLSTSKSWGFPKIKHTMLGVPVIRTLVSWDLYWSPTILGK